MTGVAVIGDAFVDLICATETLPRWGGDALLTAPVQTSPGGSASNTAAHLSSIAQKDARVTFFTALGRDPWGEMLSKALRASGADLRATIKAESTGTCVVLTGPADRCFLTNTGAMATFAPADLHAADIAGHRHVHVGGYFNMTAMFDGLPELLRQAREANPALTVSLDTNYDASETWGRCGASEDNHLLRLLREVDLFLPNEVEAMGISGKDTPEAALQWLQDKVRKGGVVVVTCGTDGVIVQGQEVPLIKVDAPQVQHVDATGAGDAFNAGFLFRWAVQGRGLEEAARAGVRCGSKIIQVKGACNSLLTAADLAADLATGEAGERATGEAAGEVASE